MTVKPQPPPSPNNRKKILGVPFVLSSGKERQWIGFWLAYSLSYVVRFAGFLVRSFFRASFPYFFRLKKGLFLALEPNSLVFRNWRKLARRRRRKSKIRRRFIVVVAWGIAIWSSLSIIDAVAPPAPLPTLVEEEEEGGSGKW